MLSSESIIAMIVLRQTGGWISWSGSGKGYGRKGHWLVLPSPNLNFLLRHYDTPRCVCGVVGDDALTAGAAAGDWTLLVVLLKPNCPSPTCTISTTRSRCRTVRACWRRRHRRASLSTASCSTLCRRLSTSRWR